MSNNNNRIIKQLFTIGLPIILQSILQTMLPMIDQIMVGQLGDDVIAAIGISGKLFNIYFFILLAIAGVAAIYISQYWGSQQLDMLPKTLRIPIISGSVCIGLLLIVAFVFPVSSMRLFTNNEEIAEMAAEFQKVYAVSAIPLMFTCLYSSLLRGTLKVKIPMISGIISVVLNTSLNYVLMFGFGPVKGMGAWGAVLATLISRCVEFLILAVYVHAIDKRFTVTPAAVFSGKLDTTFRKKFISSMLPLILNNLCYIFSDTVYSIFYGQMSKIEVAAQAIMLPVQSFAVGLFSGMAVATSIILGNKLGKDDIDGAVSDSKVILRFVLITTLITSVIVGLLSMVYLRFFKIDDDLHRIAQYMLYAASAYLTVKVMNMVICQGVLESGGDTKFILINNIIGPICIGIPLAFLSFYVLHLPIYWMFSLVSLEEVVRLINCYVKYRKNDWAHNITIKTNEVS